MRIRAMIVAIAVAIVTTATAQPGPASAATVAPGAPAPGTAASQTCAKPGGTLVAYGHSYLHSPRIGGAPSSYATIAASSLGAKPVIRAINRGTSADVERLVRQGSTRWVPGSAQLVLIDSGINDIGRKLSTEQWTGALRRTLETFAVPPVPTILLVRPLPVTRAGHPGRDRAVVARYAEAQAQVAGQFSAVRIVDATSGWDPRRQLSRDGLHPNAAGMEHIARAVQGTAQGSCGS